MHTFSKNIFSENIRVILARKGLSQADLANAAGIKPQQLSIWITGKRRISSKNLSKVAAALGVPVEELTREDTDSKDRLGTLTEENVRRVVRQEVRSLLEEFIPRPSEIRLVADNTLTYEPTEIALEIPPPADDLSKSNRVRYEKNAKVLRRYAAARPAQASMVPLWALEKFCREAEAAYAGGSLDDIEGILKDYIEGQGEK